ncbi:hypothetical protein G6F50_018747 [Rhizopus delemar]|uniref:Uncharacterized protein n=1 Tax=Rhizopus delemar TaxID=936053 RepID=A0A9P6XL70_9FUNG|nr:hypothetical protein G6F50_018747 [Rhizopus delemar]
MRDHRRDARRATRQQRLVLRPPAGLHRRPAAPPQPREEQGGHRHQDFHDMTIDVSQDEIAGQPAGQ